jgi:hypothetical protein
MKSLRLACLLTILLTTAVLAQTNPAPLSQPPVTKNRLSQPDPAEHSKFVESYGKLPLSFEANQGQTDGRVKFLSRGSGYTLFLTADEAVFSLQGNKSKDDTGQISPQHRRQAAPKANAILRMKLLHANPASKITGADELPGKSNHFIGNDPQKWRSNVPTYTKVKYDEIYSGIDLIYYGNPRQLEYDFVVAPGADPRRIQFDVRGATTISKDKDGDLVLHFQDGELRWRKPVLYQEKDGSKQAINGRYVVRHGHRVSFDIGSYDRTRVLTIDPALAYSTFLGGTTGFADAYSVAVDSAGNAYLAGYTRAWDFPTTPGAFQTTCPSGAGEYECGTWGAAFITKMNPTGTALVYSTYLGGSQGAQGEAIAIDSAGDAYVTGGTYSTNFPTTPGALQTTCLACAYPTDGDAFVTELNPTGSGLIYSTYLGGNPPGQALGQLAGSIAIDASGDAYVVGFTNSSDFPTTPGAFQTTCAGCGISSDDGFVSELNPSGSALIYSTYLGGSHGTEASAIALDATGDAYVTGDTLSTDFPVTPGAFQTTCSQPYCWDAFVTELNSTGTGLVYSTFLGGGITNGTGQAQFGAAIALASNGEVYVTGETGSPSFPTTPGAFQTTCHNCISGGASVFVTEFNSAGSALIYSTYIGGSTEGTTDQARGIVLDAAGDVYLNGYTSSLDFPTTPGSFQPTCGGCTQPLYSGFMSELNPTGSTLLYSTYLNGSNTPVQGGTAGTGIAIDAANGVYLVGSTNSSTFPITPGAFQTSCGSSGCTYVTKFVAGDQVWPLTLSFGSQPIGIGSTPQNTVLTNSGTTALAITSITITGTSSGDFGEQDNCGTSLPAGNSCNIAVTFTPTALGTRTASLAIADSAANSPQSIALSGTGSLTVTLLPPSLNFGSQALGTTSQSLPVMLSTAGTLIINSIVASGPFAQTNNCGTALPAGGSCTINATFTPQALGPQSGTLTVTDDATGSPQTVTLSGTGILTATLSPPNLSFGSEGLGATSQPLPVTLSTNGTLIISSIIASPPFAQTNNCGTSLPAGASCTMNLTFTPQALGPQSGTLTVTDDATGSPQIVPLSGSGVSPMIPNPSSLNFGNQTVGITSFPLTSTLTNVGNIAVSVISIVIGGANSSAFAQMNNCPASIPPNASCTISVTFSPTMLQGYSASLTITDSAPGSPQIVPLTGNGAGPIVTLSPPNLIFPDQYVGTSGLPQTVTLTNIGSGGLTITAVTTVGATTPADFGSLNACGSGLAPGASCVIGVFFDPAVGGTRSGTLSITDNAAGSPQMVALTGVGQDFSMSASGSSTATVSPGGTATYALTIAPAGGFNQSVSFTCSGAPAGSVCSVPATVTLNGSAPTKITVTVTTAATSGNLVKPGSFSSIGGRLTMWLALSGLPGLVILSGPPACRRYHSRRQRLAFACLLLFGTTWVACGGGGSVGVGPSYNLTVTGTFSSGTAKLTHNTNLTLVVQ